ncbi:hemerythrin domain-containing protein [Streptomyces sp. 4N509B]|uniref:hemerythrin domain-containing protein n=1 Tax=Streptomyces sp. 4N509B TaxID=3457413 RepID=UPI003FD24DD2
MTPPTSALPKPHQTMILAHRAMVRDLDRIARTAAELAERPDAERVRALRAYGLRIAEIIHHHHEGEDDILWPALKERGADEEALELMQREHADLHRGLDEMRESLEALGEDAAGAGALEKAARATHDLLREHAADEERELAGRLAPALDAAVWKQFERGMVKSAARWTLSFMPPWLASVAGEDERGGVPAPPVARLMRGRLRRQQEAAFGALA